MNLCEVIEIVSVALTQVDLGRLYRGLALPPPCRKQKDLASCPLKNRLVGEVVESIREE